MDKIEELVRKLSSHTHSTRIIPGHWEESQPSGIYYSPPEEWIPERTEDYVILNREDIKGAKKELLGLGTGVLSDLYQWLDYPFEDCCNKVKPFGLRYITDIVIELESQLPSHNELKQILAMDDQRAPYAAMILAVLKEDEGFEYLFEEGKLKNHYPGVESVFEPEHFRICCADTNFTKNDLPQLNRLFYKFAQPGGSHVVYDLLMAVKNADDKPKLLIEGWTRILEQTPQHRYGRRHEGPTGMLYACAAAALYVFGFKEAKQMLESADIFHKDISIGIAIMDKYDKLHKSS